MNQFPAIFLLNGLFRWNFDSDCKSLAIVDIQEDSYSPRTYIGPFKISVNYNMLTKSGVGMFSKTTSHLENAPKGRIGEL